LGTGHIPPPHPVTWSRLTSRPQKETRWSTVNRNILVSYECTGHTGSGRPWAECTLIHSNPPKQKAHWTVVDGYGERTMYMKKTRCFLGINSYPP
jgi:hypothetical protein